MSRLIMSRSFHDRRSQSEISIGSWFEPEIGGVGNGTLAPRAGIDVRRGP